MQSDTIAPAAPAIPPSADVYAKAFYGLEDRILSIARHAKVADHLVGQLYDRIAKVAPGEEALADLAQGQVTDLQKEIDDLDEAYLATFNDLVGRENVARGFPG